MKRNSLIMTWALCWLLLSCGDESPNGPSKVPRFSISPIEYTAISQATPLGNLNPPGHVFPTSHIGFYLKGNSLVAVRALSEGTVSSIHFNSGFNDNAVYIKCSKSFSYYFDHLKNLGSAIIEGAIVHTGDLIGYGNPATAAVDLGILDYDIMRQFINPGRYHENSLHCGDPYLYFEESVRDSLLTFNPRTVEPRGGKIDFDIDGALSGNWFLPETPVTYEASSYLYGANQLAFVYDMYDPAKIRICCGGTLNLAPFNGLVDGNAPDPAAVTMSSGLVKYELLGFSRSTILAQMVAARQIKVEVFANKKKNEVADFTAAAKIYIR